MWCVVWCSQRRSTQLYFLCQALPVFVHSCAFRTCGCISAPTVRYTYHLFDSCLVFSKTGPTVLSLPGFACLYCCGLKKRRCVWLSTPCTHSALGKCISCLRILSREYQMEALQRLTVHCQSSVYSAHGCTRAHSSSSSTQQRATVPGAEPAPAADASARIITSSGQQHQQRATAHSSGQQHTAARNSTQQRATAPAANDSACDRIRTCSRRQCPRHTHQDLLQRVVVSFE